jgi:hypothetical protein
MERGGSEMTRRQERTADADNTSWLRVYSATNLQEASIPLSSRALYNAHSTPRSRISKVLYFLFTPLFQMATLTVIPYIPTPPSYIIRKPSSKRIAPQPSSVKKNVRFDFVDVPIEKLHASGGATGGSNLQREVARDSKARVEDAQVSRDDLAASELGKLIDPSDSERWYDVEAGCYVDNEVGTQGMYSDYTRRSLRLCLMLYQQPRSPRNTTPMTILMTDFSQ